jgi:hypothetical protein
VSEGRSTDVGDGPQDDDAVEPAVSPDDGINVEDKDKDGDAAVTSPGAWTPAAAPGKPDGEVDTRG